MPSTSNLIIAAIWGLAIWNAVRGATGVPSQTPIPGNIPLLTFVTIVLLPLVVFGVSSSWMRHSPFYHPKLAQFINARLGVTAYESFLVRLRPLLVFAFGATLPSLVGLWNSYKTGAPLGGYVMSAFFLSGGLAFALTHVVLYFRRAVGVYPTWNLQQPEVPAPARKTLVESLRSYWWALIGVGLFPSVVIVGGEFLHVPFEVFILPFFAVVSLAGWTWLSGRAPYSFWLVACGVWFLGGIVAVIMTGLIRAIRA